MKLAKALYFIAFLLAIKVLIPGSNNYVEANPEIINTTTKDSNNSFTRKNKNNKVAVISTILATLALAAAGTTFGVMHLKKKEGDSKKKPVLSDMKTTPLVAPASNNKNKPTMETNTKPTTFNYDPKIGVEIHHCSY
ncbi:early transcribed membrane protein [Plasmodium vinckei]|uniref:Early transcribed membrane protein n=1 Tax=Plasmodium vinckei TaxID=5860 RepID=A0A6V7SRL5_PLAVN|nr:early transcribed membrane protein [Plasmodium vinckei]